LTSTVTRPWSSSRASHDSGCHQGSYHDIGHFLAYAGIWRRGHNAARIACTTTMRPRQAHSRRCSPWPTPRLPRAAVSRERQRGCCHWRPGLSSRPVAMGSGSAPHRSGSLPWLREWTTHSTDANIAYQADRCLMSNSPAPEASGGLAKELRLSNGSRAGRGGRACTVPPLVSENNQPRFRE
jgi:hypothetical protein